MWMHNRNKKREEARQAKLSLTQHDGIETRGPQDTAGLAVIVTAKPGKKRTAKRRIRSNLEQRKQQSRKNATKKQRTAAATTTTKRSKPKQQQPRWR